MARDVLALADRLWNGEPADIETLLLPETQLAEVADGTAFVPSFGNVSAFATGDGLVLVDSGAKLTAQRVFETVRGWRTDRVSNVVFSHGHIDHVFGVMSFDAEAAERGWPAPEVVAHEAVPARFDRYRLTAGYNGVINGRQFQIPDLVWPTEFRRPDRLYRDEFTMTAGDEVFELHHARGETDDHTWTWVPGRRVLCCGDLFIWVSPNAGNPQKVQRYPREWAAALRAMAALGAEVLLPGHGVPLVGADRVSRALTDTADLLDSLVDQSLELMNAGARLDDLIHTVRVPPHLAGRPYLRPIYDEPEFIVRNVWRLYGGWYDGNPASLKPARAAALAAEIADLADGAGRLADRALALIEGSPSDEQLRLAGHLAEFAALAAPDDAAVHQARATVFGRRAAEATSVMTRGIFASAAAESRRPGPGASR